MSSATSAPPSRRRRRLAVPPQHGAWAYLALPLVLSLALSGWTPIGVVFAVAWVLAYPASYYGGRALTIRLRRGSWTRLARRELVFLVPWSIAAGIGAVVLVVLRPWLVAVGAALAVLWLVGVRLALAGRERGFGNDLLLIGQSLLALPLLWAVSADSPLLRGVPAAIWLATAVCAAYFVGSVVHVKSLIREAGDPRWHRANIGYHVVALAMGFVGPWLLIPFVACLGRSLALRPTAKPAAIGVVEIVMSVLVLVCTLLTTGVAA